MFSTCYGFKHYMLFYICRIWMSSWKYRALPFAELMMFGILHNQYYFHCSLTYLFINTHIYTKYICIHIICLCWIHFLTLVIASKCNLQRRAGYTYTVSLLLFNEIVIAMACKKNISFLLSTLYSPTVQHIKIYQRIATFKFDLRCRETLDDKSAIYDNMVSSQHPHPARIWSDKHC